MPVIYVPQEQHSKNISAALQYGSHIVSCVSQDYQVYTSTSSTIEKIRKALVNFTSEDYLLLIGDPILIGLTVAEAFRQVPSVKVLKWDSQSRTYVPVVLDFFNES